MCLAHTAGTVPALRAMNRTPRDTLIAETEALDAEGLTALVVEWTENVAHLEGSVGLLRKAIRALAETDTNPGRMWVLAKVTVCLNELKDKDGMLARPFAESVATSIASLASLDPELPGLVAATGGALEALTRAAEVLETGGHKNAQAMWLPHVHEAFVLLGLVKPLVTSPKTNPRPEAPYEVTRKALLNHAKVRVDVRKSTGSGRLLSLLAERDY